MTVGRLPAPVALTQNMQAVAEYLLNHEGRDVFGREIVAATGIGSDGVSRVLNRFERVGWLTSSREDQSADLGRAARRYYRIADGQAEQLRAVLQGPVTPPTR